ncbi:hypothetical protein ACWCQN_24350 [Streptomyces sp. NPDC001984]
MFDKPDLKLYGPAEVDGQPLLCSECGSGFSHEVHKHGNRETWPAWICCTQAITNGLVDAVLASRLARETDAERDVFTAEWRGIVMTGELMPLLDMHQLIGAAKAARQGISKESKAWWRRTKRTAKARVKGAAGDVVSTAKAGAVTAAWTMQTGGAGPTSSRPKRRRCTVKGCWGGMVTISTRVHSTTGKAQKVKVPCGVCHRGGPLPKLRRSDK